MSRFENNPEFEPINMNVEQAEDAVVITLARKGGDETFHVPAEDAMRLGRIIEQVAAQVISRAREGTA